MSENILITGTAGFLGSNLYKYFCKKYNTFGILKDNDNVDINSKKKIFCDVLNYQDLCNQVSKISPKIIINTIGLANVELSEKNKKLAKLINIKTSINLAKLANKTKSKFIHFSTDHFFSDHQKFYKEDDKVNLLNFYSKTKYQAEENITKILSSPLIIRANFFGISPKQNSFAEKIIDKISNKENINLFDDIFYNPIYVASLSEYLNKLIINKSSGIFNVSTDESISKYDFGVKVAEKFRLDKNFIIRSSIDTKKDLVKRPKCMTLSNLKIKKEIKIKHISISKNLDLFFKDYIKKINNK